jgi:heterodisulfide reductase subunit A
MRFLDDADGAALNDTFDMIVLSIGIAPGADNAELAKTTGIELNADGFFTAADAQTKTATSQHGIFLAGTVEGPRTIAASIAHAGQAASDVINHLGVSHD